MNDDSEQVTPFNRCSLNDTIKFTFLILNCLYFLAGAVLLFWTSITASTTWADLNGQTFSSLATFLVVSSVVVVVITLLGCLGALNQIVRKGKCQGRRLLGVYDVALIVMIIFQIQIVVYILNSVGALEDVRGQLQEGQTSVEYAEFEDDWQDEFNDYYFSTYSKQNTHTTFWTFINKKCPSTMAGTICSGSSYASSCPNKYLCNNGDQSSCPFDMCRLAVDKKIINTLDPFGQGGLVLVFVELVVLILVCLLICYNPHDDEETILLKSGNVALISDQEAARRAARRRKSEQTSRVGGDEPHARVPKQKPRASQSNKTPRDML